MLQAKAIYDNHSESSEELSFRSGDVLTVVEKNVNGLEGWWLCYHGNKLGIAPGNRLKVLKKSTVPEDKDKTLTRDDSTRDYNNYNTPSSINDNNIKYFVEGNKVRDNTNTADTLYDLPASVDKINYLQYAAKANNHNNYASSSTSNSNVTSSNPASSCGSNSPNRSSLLSMLSTGSSSLSDSARSSADVSFAMYDTLPQCNSNKIQQSGLLKCEENFSHIARGIRGTEKSSNSMASCSSDDQRDSYLDDYSIPRNNNCDKNLIIVTSTNDINNEFVNVADSKGFFEDLYDSPKRCLNANISPPSSSSLSSPVKSSSTALPTSSSFDDSTLKGHNKQVVDQLYDTPQSLVNQSNDLNNDVKLNATFNIETASQNYINPSNDHERPMNNPNTTNIKQPNSQMSLPTNILPILSLQDDIKRYNYKLKCLIVEKDDTIMITRMDDEFEQVTLKQSQIKLCCLSLKSALKELIDFACNLKLDVNINDNNDKNLHVQNIKDKIELLKCSLKEFEDKTNELLTFNVKKHNSNIGNTASSGKKINNKQFLQNLLMTASKLPLVSERFVTDVCSYFTVSNVNIDKCSFTGTASADDDISALSPSKPKLPAPRVSSSNAQQLQTVNASLARKSIQNRPLPAPPLNNFRLTTPHRPQQQIHYRYSSPGSNTFDTNSGQQHQSCPGLINNSIGLPVLHSPKSTSQHLQHQHSTPNSFSFPSQQHPNSASSLQRQHTIPQSNVQAFQQQLDPMVGTDESDSLLVAFYASQIEMHLELVKKSASKFRKAMFNCSTKLLSHQFSQQLLPTPKEFVLRSKFVILAAHKLVYVADAIARNLADPTRYLDIAESANKLCTALKVAVNSTKESALQHEDAERRDLMVKSIQFVVNASEELCEVIKRYKRPLDSDDDGEEGITGSKTA